MLVLKSLREWRLASREFFPPVVLVVVGFHSAALILHRPLVVPDTWVVHHLVTSGIL